MRHTVKYLFLAVVLCSFSLPISASMNVAAMHIDNPKLVGQGRLKFMLWNVFDASLYSGSGQYDDSEPFALSLSYLRKLDGTKIVAKSMEEIRQQKLAVDAAALESWGNQLGKIIPDVSDGSSITGVRTTQGHTLFYLGNEYIGQIEDVAFTNAFFSIWLGENTSQPRLRNSLTGLDRAS